MPRPAVDHWFDSTIRIWRPLAVKDALMVEEKTHVEMSTVGARLNRSATSTADVGPGASRVGRLRWYGRPDIDVQRRDICEILTGPDAGLTWEVDAEPVHPANHHTQVDCVEWHGKLPAVAES